MGGFFVIFCTAPTAFVDRPIEDMLSAIAMWVRHTASISAVVCLDLHRQEFPDQVCVTEGMDHPETGCASPSQHLLGSLHLLASPRIRSTSSSGVSPAFYPDLFQLVNPTSLGHRVVHGAV